MNADGPVPVFTAAEVNERFAALAGDVPRCVVPFPHPCELLAAVQLVHVTAWAPCSAFLCASHAELLHGALAWVNSHPDARVFCPNCRLRMRPGDLTLNQLSEVER